MAAIGKWPLIGGGCERFFTAGHTDCFIYIFALGTFGQRRLWDSLEIAYQPRRQKTVPADIQRVASHGTLRVLTGSGSRFR